MMEPRHVRGITAAILTAAKMGSDGANGTARAPELFAAEYEAMLTALKGAKRRHQPAGVSI